MGTTATGTLDTVSSVPTARERPVAVVEDLDDSGPERGVVRLPRHIRWSGEPIEFDLANPRHLRSVYEQVLREGTDADVRRYVRRTMLLEVWNELFLPEYVRAAWAPWIEAQRARR